MHDTLKSVPDENLINEEMSNKASEPEKLYFGLWKACNSFVKVQNALENGVTES